jgi:hypothetical protein
MRKLTASRAVGLGVVSAVGVLALAACSSSSPSGSGAANAANAANATTAASVSAPATQAPVSSAPATTQAAGAPIALDPCQLVTRSEASSIAGVAYGAGKEETFSGGGKGCVYGSQTVNVFTVELAQATSPAVAQAAWSQEQTQAKALLLKQIPPGMKLSYNLNPASGLGDRAATVSAGMNIAGRTIGISGIYVLKGRVFFAYQDLVVGHSAPAVAALEAEARTVLGRIS